MVLSPPLPLLCRGRLLLHRVLILTPINFGNGIFMSCYVMSCHDHTRRHATLHYDIISIWYHHVTCLYRHRRNGYLVINGYLVLRGDIPWRTSTSKHIVKLLARKRIGTRWAKYLFSRHRSENPRGLMFRGGAAWGSSPQVWDADQSLRHHTACAGGRPKFAETH